MSEFILEAQSPHYRRPIVYHRANWRRHLDKHPEITERFIHEILLRYLTSADSKDVSYWVEKRNPFDHLIYVRLPHFEPQNRYAKIVVVLKESRAEIKSVYPTFNLPDKGMVSYGTASNQSRLRRES